MGMIKELLATTFQYIIIVGGNEYDGSFRYCPIEKDC